jgi:hypothetical protein
MQVSHDRLHVVNPQPEQDVSDALGFLSHLFGPGLQLDGALPRMHKAVEAFVDRLVGFGTQPFVCVFVNVHTWCLGACHRPCARVRAYVIGGRAEHESTQLVDVANQVIICVYAYLCVRV